MLTAWAVLFIVLQIQYVKKKNNTTNVQAGAGGCDITWLNSAFSSEALVRTGGTQPGLAGFHDY